MSDFDTCILFFNKLYDIILSMTDTFNSQNPDLALNLPERIALLSRHDESGAKQGSFTDYAVAGATLVELILQDRLETDADNPKKINVIDTSPTNDDYLDEALAFFERKGSGKTAQSLVSSLGGKTKILRLVAEGLVKRGILQAQKQSFLVFSWTNYPEADPRPETALKSHLADIMFGDQTPDARDCVVIALAKEVDLLKKNFDKLQLKEHKQRMKDIASGEVALTDSTIRAVRAIRTAVIVAATVPAIVASSSSG